MGDESAWAGPNVWRQWRAQRVHCTPGLGRDRYEGAHECGYENGLDCDGHGRQWAGPRENCTGRLELRQAWAGEKLRAAT